MRLNTINPAPGAKKVGKRLGRGIGTGKGKTCGKGHKGQKARAGGYHKVGFEGGQMPLQRRIPKSGFRSRKSLYRQEIRLSNLNKVTEDVIDLNTLKASGLINANIKTVKIIACGGALTKPKVIRNILVSAGAKSAIEAAGGKIEV
jgi:large subunit ribosomal protein L15